MFDLFLFILFQNKSHQRVNKMVNPTNIIPGKRKYEQISSSDLSSNASTPTHSSATISTPTNFTNINDADNFGIFVAQRLQKLPDNIKRRKLEIMIQEAILMAEKDALE